MGEFFAQLLIVGLILWGVIASEQKKKRRQQANQKPADGAPRGQQAAKAPQRRQNAQAAGTPRAVLPPRPVQTVRQAIQPTLHDHSGMFAGSLQADDGTEGSDPHDHGFDHEVDMPSDHSEEVLNASLAEGAGAEKPRREPQPKPLLDWAPDSLVRAVVMQEILRRPSAR